jgi:hypothetical protein
MQALPVQPGRHYSHPIIFGSATRLAVFGSMPVPLRANNGHRQKERPPRGGLSEFQTQISQSSGMALNAQALNGSGFNAPLQRLRLRCRR